MPQIKSEDIDRIRQKADIAEVIGRYLPLQKRGRNYAALCPFHNDHDPSLSISTDKQIYKCFVCNNGGNVFTFVQNYEKISFPEAVLKVADIIGEPLDYARDSFTYEKYDDETRRSFKIFNEAIDYLSYQLYSEGAQDVLDYLHQRGYDDDLIRYFRIGYNPENNSLYRFLKAKGYTERDLLKINLIRQTADGFADMFSRRIIFPIFNSDNQPVAFNGRASRPNQEPKYVNSESTELYVKGNLLYNYHNARQSIKESGKVYVVEGVTDVYAFYRAGIYNAVATLGTAMSRNQVQLLKNLRCEVVLCYDGDAAGQNANLKNARQLNDANVTVSIVRNETGLDPDELIRDRGMDSFKSVIAAEEVYMEFFMRAFARNVDFNNYNQRRSYAERVVNEISKIKDTFDRENFLRKLSEMTGFDKAQLETLVKELPKKEPEEKNSEIRIEKKVRSGKIRTECEIICQMLSSKNAASRFQKKMGYLPSDVTNHLAMAILDYYLRYDTMSIADLLNEIEEDDTRQLLLDLVDDESFVHAYDEKALDQAFSRIRISIIDDSAKAIRKQLAMTADADKRRELETRLASLKKEKNDLLAK